MSTVIPNRFYQHPKTKARVGLYTSFVPPGFELISEGFAVSHPDGTSGLGRPPFKTETEAQACCDAHPRFRGMTRYGSEQSKPEGVAL